MLSDVQSQFARRPPLLPTTVLGGARVERVNQTQLLGVITTDHLKWQGHTDYVCGKASSRLHFLRMLRGAGVDPKDIMTTYIALVHFIMEYAYEVWHTGLTVQQSEQLEQVQRGALSVAYPAFLTVRPR